MNNRNRTVERFLFKIKHKNYMYFFKRLIKYIWRGVYDPYPRKIKKYHRK